jgi:hypothetical protein
MAAADAMMAIDDDARCNGVGVTLYDRFVEYVYTTKAIHFYVSYTIQFLILV